MTRDGGAGTRRRVVAGRFPVGQRDGSPPLADTEPRRCFRIHRTRQQRRGSGFSLSQSDRTLVRVQSRLFRKNVTASVPGALERRLLILRKRVRRLGAGSDETGSGAPAPTVRARAQVVSGST